MSCYNADWAAEILFYIIPCSRPNRHSKKQKHCLTWLLNLFHWRATRYFFPFSWGNKQFEPFQLSVVVVSVGLSHISCVARECVQLFLLLNYSCKSLSSPPANSIYSKFFESSVVICTLDRIVAAAVTGKSLVQCCFYTEVTLLTHIHYSFL